MEFQYFEVRPCIKGGDEVQSFRDHAEFGRCRAELDADKAPYEHFWTIYGMSGAVAVAIGDFVSQAVAFEVMNAILAPMAAARDLANEAFQETGNHDAMKASDLLDDFINQCSNEERV